jgi:hypothetical protein
MFKAVLVTVANPEFSQKRGGVGVPAKFKVLLT